MSNGNWKQLGDLVGTVMAELREERGLAPKRYKRQPSADPCEGVGGSGFAGGGLSGMEMQLMQGAARAQSAPTRAAALYMNCTEAVH
jgi:hypothetical protein